jgi:3-(3-hydroxy-phenyl)propionate hydroxylase
VISFAWTPLDISDFPTRHNHGLALWQGRFEQILAEWVDELGVRIYRGREVTGFDQDQDGVDVHLADGGRVRAEYLVGCDGGRSVVRKCAAIAFDGWEPSVSTLIAEVEVREEPEPGAFRDERGVHAIGRLDDGRVRVVIREEQVGRSGDPTLRNVSEMLISVRGTDYGVHSPTWISRFTDTTRLAASFRDRRVLLAGDAAHVHYPVGGQGLNIGVQDAVNLGWKLAQVVKRQSPDSLLDTYHDERHPVAQRVLQNTMAQTVLLRSEPRLDALRGILAELLGMDEPRKRIAGMMSGLDVHYDLGDGHPLLGRRMPDLDIETTTGATRVYALMHDARAVLLNLGSPGSLDIAQWRDRIRLVDAVYAGQWELPVLGEVSPATAVLVRPDGHVAWVGAGSDDGLHDAAIRWFGAASAS